MFGLEEELEYWYSQEQNVTIWSFWDGGWVVAFGSPESKNLEEKHYCQDLKGVVDYLHEHRGTR